MSETLKELEKLPAKAKLELLVLLGDMLGDVDGAAALTKAHVDAAAAKVRAELANGDAPEAA